MKSQIFFPKKIRTKEMIILLQITYCFNERGVHTRFNNNVGISLLCDLSIIIVKDTQEKKFIHKDTTQKYGLALIKMGKMTVIYFPPSSQ